jgi:plastocyanin
MMKDNFDSLRVTTYFLLAFLVVVGVAVWLLNLITQWRVFGFLMSAEFTAFAMLVYLFYMEDPVVAKKVLTSGFVALGILIILAGAVLAGVGAPVTLPKPNVSITLYAGEVSPTLFGFGNSATSITSPGPTLNFTVGDVVNMTVFNAGTMPHNWALVASNDTSGKVLFGAQIDSGQVPIPVNESASVVFKVTKTGNYYYICQVAGHVQLGMWGNVVMNP